MPIWSSCCSFVVFLIDRCVVYALSFVTAAIPTIFCPGLMLLVVVLDDKLQLRPAIAAWALSTAALVLSLEVGCVRASLVRRLSCRFCVWSLPRHYDGGLPVIGGAWAALSAAMHSWQAALAAAAGSAAIVLFFRARRRWEAHRASFRQTQLRVVRRSARLKAVRRSARAALEQAFVDEDDIVGLQSAIEAYEQMDARSIEEISDKQGALESARLEFTERASRLALGLTLHLAPAAEDLVDISATNIAGDELASLQVRGDMALIEVRRRIALDVRMLEAQVQMLLADGTVLTDLADMTVAELLGRGLPAVDEDFV